MRKSYKAVHASIMKYSPTNAHAEAGLISINIHFYRCSIVEDSTDIEYTINSANLFKYVNRMSSALTTEHVQLQHI